MNRDDDENVTENVVSLNQELMRCDFDELDAEALEQRLELAIAALPLDLNSACTRVNDCNGFSGSGACEINYCHTF